ncbi:hypothetical protein R1sor_000191 [Riccia sorocarpa]|uniref:Uncharacterized protein n=1 Tax=Riccia sorocarpa TaxID=122646 RepID=A0ABD3GUX4_9MARC
MAVNCRSWLEMYVMIIVEMRRRTTRPYKRPPLMSPILTAMAEDYADNADGVNAALQDACPSPDYNPVHPGLWQESLGYVPGPSPGYMPGPSPGYNPIPPVIHEEGPGYAPDPSPGYQPVPRMNHTEIIDPAGRGENRLLGTPGTPQVGYLEIVGPITMPTVVEVVAVPVDEISEGPSSPKYVRRYVLK